MRRPDPQVSFLTWLRIHLDRGTAPVKMVAPAKITLETKAPSPDIKGEKVLGSFLEELPQRQAIQEKIPPEAKRIEQEGSGKIEISEESLSGFLQTLKRANIYIQWEEGLPLDKMGKTDILSLMDALKGANPETKLAAAGTIVLLAKNKALGAEEPQVLDVLLDLLEKGEPSLKPLVAQSLGYIKLRTPSVIAALKKALDGEGLETRKRVLESLGRFGAKASSTVDELIKILQDSPELRDLAVLTLYEIGPCPQASTAVPFLKSLLKRDEKIKIESVLDRHILKTLTRIQPDDQEILRWVAELFETIDWSTGDSNLPGELDPGQIALLESLGQLGKYFFQPITMISTILKGSSDSEIRYLALEALEEIGSKASPTQPLIEENLGDPHWRVRLKAAGALLKIDSRRPPEMDIFIQALKQEGESHLLRMEAAQYLEKIGLWANEAISPLIDLLREEKDPQIRSGIIRALGAIKTQPDLIVPVLAEVLFDPEESVRREGARSLARFGPPAADAMDSLVQAFQQEESQQNKLALAYALGEMGASVEPALPILEKALSTEQYWPLRVQLAWAVAKIDVDGLPPINAFIQALRERDLLQDVIAMMAIQGLATFAFASSEVISILQKIAEKDPEASVAMAARRALNKLLK